MRLFDSIMALSMIDSYQDTVKIGGDDTIRDYRTIFGVANNYLFECVTNFIKYKGYPIKEKFPGFLKFQTGRDFGVARVPKEGVYLIDYTEFKNEMYRYVNSNYDCKSFEDSVHEASLYHKLYQKYFDIYQVVQVEPKPSEVFLPEITYKFKILNRSTQQLLRNDKIAVEHFVPQFDAHSYYFNLLLLEVIKEGKIKL